MDIQKIIDKFPDIETQVFLDYAKSVCNLHSFDLHLVQRENLKYKGQKYAGELDFSGKRFRIAVAKPKEDMLTIFVHEFSHLNQWIDEDPIFYSTQLDDGSDAYDNFMQWITGDIDLSPQQAVQYGKLARNFEIDCDKRAVEEIKFWELPVDLDKYIQKSNSYHLLYNYISKHRFWPDISPYHDKYIKLWKSMPKTWIQNPDRPPAHLMKLYEEAYGKGK